MTDNTGRRFGTIVTRFLPGGDHDSSGLGGDLLIEVTAPDAGNSALNIRA